jgi:biopolymer transport protein ExbB/TolQ
MGSLGGVTSGLGTSFDTTLLGLLYSILLSFPMSALQKGEDDSLNTIDAYCNETLLPRLNDGGGSGGSGGGNVAGEMRQLVDTILAAQKQFVADLRDVSGLVRDQVVALEARATRHSDEIVKNVSHTLAHLERATTTGVESSTAAVTAHIAALQQGLDSLNTVLKAVGERQVHVEVRPRSLWRRLIGR